MAGRNRAGPTTSIANDGRAWRLHAASHKSVAIRQFGPMPGDPDAVTGLTYRGRMLALTCGGDLGCAGNFNCADALRAT